MSLKLRCSKFNVCHPNFELITFSVRSKLAEWLPLALRFTKLDLIYTTNHHGRTIDNFYRHVSKAKHTVLLLEPLNTSNLIVGCYASQTWHLSTRVYGDGNCFLFRKRLTCVTMPEPLQTKKDGKHSCVQKYMLASPHRLSSTRS